MSPDDIPGLLRITSMLERAAEVCPDLRWSVRDGQHAIRRHGRRWTVSRRRGRVVRDAGWFEEPAHPTPARPPLVPLEDDSDLLLDEQGFGDDLILDDSLSLDPPLDPGEDIGDDLVLEDDIDLGELLVPEAPAPVGLAGLTTGARPEATDPAPSSS